MSEEWKECVNDWFETGSSVVVDPPVMDTDIDIVAWIDDVGDIDAICDLGFEYGGSFNPDSEYHSLRSGELNLILTTTKLDFDKFKLATRVAKLLNIHDKPKRVALFEAIRHGEFRYND